MHEFGDGLRDLLGGAVLEAAVETRIGHRLLVAAQMLLSVFSAQT